jgi:TonB family protein
MQIRRLWHIVLGITCALAFNSMLILLLILSSPKKHPAPVQPPAGHFGWLSRLQTAPSLPVTPAKTGNLTPNNRPQVTAIKISEESEAPQTVSAASEPEKTFESEEFFQRGHELLAQFNAPHIASKKKVDSISSSEIRYLEPVQFYLRNALNHILPYKATLHKKYAKLRRERAELIEKQPNIEITIAKNGSLKNIFLKASSGSPTYDKFCMQVIKQACPLPKIPDYLKLDFLAFEI